MIQFNDHCNMVVSGCSMSGKTSLVGNILLNAGQLFPTKPSKIIYAYTMWQPLFEELMKSVNNITFMKGLPNEECIMNLTNQLQHTIVVLDDMYEDVVNSEFVRNMVTKLGHHLKITTILIMQGNYDGKYRSDILKNMHYTIMTNSPRSTHSVRSIGIQLGDCRNLMKAYLDCTSINFGYLLIDSHPLSNRKYAYRTRIFPQEDCIVYTRE